MALKDSAYDVDNAITREGRRGMSYENAFGGILSFMRRNYSKDLVGVDIAITFALIRHLLPLDVSIFDSLLTLKPVNVLSQGLNILNHT